MTRHGTGWATGGEQTGSALVVPTFPTMPACLWCSHHATWDLPLPPPTDPTPPQVLGIMTPGQVVPACYPHLPPNSPLDPTTTPTPATPFPLVPIPCETVTEWGQGMGWNKQALGVVWLVIEHLPPACPTCHPYPPLFLLEVEWGKIPHHMPIPHLPRLVPARPIFQFILYIPDFPYWVLTFDIFGGTGTFFISFCGVCFSGVCRTGIITVGDNYPGGGRTTLYSRQNR